MLVLVLNSNITIDTPSMDTLCISFSPLVCAAALSRTPVTLCSIFSGFEPGDAEYITTYGRFILGIKSVCIFINDITPNITATIPASNIVTGLLTLNFDNIISPFSTDIIVSVLINFYTHIY